MRTKGVPFEYLEFSRAIRGKPCARRRWRRRWRPAVRPGPGRGALPDPVLFEPGLTGMGYADPTRSAIRFRTAPRNGCQPTAADGWEVAAVETSRCNGSDRAVATVGFRPFYPSWSAINSALFSQIRTHQHQLNCVLSSEVRF